MWNLSVFIASFLFSLTCESGEVESLLQIVENVANLQYNQTKSFYGPTHFVETRMQ